MLVMMKSAVTPVTHNRRVGRDAVVIEYMKRALLVSGDTRKRFVHSSM